MAWQCLTFTADFPDDHIEQGEGSDWRVVRPGGMAVANAIVDLLRSAGMTVEAPEADLEHESWTFPTDYQERYYWVSLSDLGDSIVLTTQGSSPLFKRWFNRRDFYAEFLETVRGLLISEPRFGPVEWVDMNGRPISPR